MVSQSDIDLKDQYMSHFNLSFSVDGYSLSYLVMLSTISWPMTGHKHPRCSKNKQKGLDSLSDRLS